MTILNTLTCGFAKSTAQAFVTQTLLFWLHKFLALTPTLFILAWLYGSGATVAHAAILQAVKGSVSVVRAGVLLPAVTGMRLQPGDEVRSAVDSTDAGEVLIRFDDGGFLAFRTGSAMQIKRLPPQDALPIAGAAVLNAAVYLIRGGLRYITSKASAKYTVVFETPTATIGIRGTDLEILVSDVAVLDNNPGTYLKVNAGEASITAPNGVAVDVLPGEVAYGGEPDVSVRGATSVRRAAARKVEVPIETLFKPSSLDQQMR